MFKKIYAINIPTAYQCCFEFSANGTVVGNLTIPVNCFVSLFYNTFHYKNDIITDIKVKVRTQQISFSHEIVERWLNDLKEWDFNFTYEKDKDSYTFYYNESIKEQKLPFVEKSTKIKVALTLLRYLWHPSAFDTVLDAYFQMVDKFRPKDKLKTFYIAHTYLYSTYSSAPGQSIVGNVYYRYCGTKQFFKNIKTKQTVHSCFIKDNIDISERIFENNSNKTITEDIEIIYNKYNKLFNETD